MQKLLLVQVGRFLLENQEVGGLLHRFDLLFVDCRWRR